MKTALFSPVRVERILSRLAYEVIERNRGGDALVVLGIRSKGLVLAERLAQLIGEVEGRAFDVYGLDIQPFRDDRDRSKPLPTALPGFPEVGGCDVLLVDDVLFTGRTARAAVEAVLHHGRPRSVQLAVLIDRGHREVPIQPDYVGRTIPTKYQERVQVELAEQTSVFLEE